MTVGVWVIERLLDFVLSSRTGHQIEVHVSAEAFVVAWAMAWGFCRAFMPVDVSPLQRDQFRDA